jgi:hypothetical protein
MGGERKRLRTILREKMKSASPCHHVSRAAGPARSRSQVVYRDAPVQLLLAARLRL